MTGEVRRSKLEASEIRGARKQPIGMSPYSARALPFLTAIAENIFVSQDARNWIIQGTPAATDYTDAEVLIDEQRALRCRGRAPKQPFWANYWCGRDRHCTCRIEGSRALESDAIFFFRNHHGRVLAVHVEFKCRGEQFLFGQPEAYPLRAACFARTHQQRPKVNAHDDWVTVIFCDKASLGEPRLSNFQRIITHDEAAQILARYPLMTV